MNIDSAHPARRDSAGFTLIEVMIVVVIISIIAALGYPSYMEFVTRSNRQVARTVLYQVADRQEQFFLDNKRYAADLVELLNLPEEALGLGVDREGQFVGEGSDARIYLVTIPAGDDLSYTLRAAPQLVQAERDTDCGWLELTNTGDRDQEFAGDRCW